MLPTFNHRDGLSQSLAFAHLAEVLVTREHITMDILAEMGHDELKQVGVVAYDHICRLMRRKQLSRPQRQLLIYLPSRDTPLSDGPRESFFQFSALEMAHTPHVHHYIVGKSVLWDYEGRG